VEQPGAVLVDPHAGAEQIGIVATAGGP
jgi:hypothetical protein